MVNGQKVVKGMRLTAGQCKRIDAVEQRKALDWVRA
jgi:lysozyme